MEAAVSALVGHPIAVRAGAPLAIRLAAHRDAPRAWSVRIVITSPNAEPSERRIEGESCDQVADAAAVAVALALAPPAAPPPPPPPPAAPPPPAPLREAPLAPPPPRRQPDVIAPPPISRVPIGVGMRLAGDLDFAALPTPAPGAALAVALFFGDHRVELGGAAFLVRHATFAAMPSAGADIALFLASARYCRSFHLAPFTLAGCGGLEAGAMPARATGIASPNSGAAPWIAPHLGALGTWSLSRTFALALSVDGIVPLLRRAFVIDGVGEIYRSPPITARASLGLEVRFR